MADISITAASVFTSAPAGNSGTVRIKSDLLAGATITAGQAVYIDTGATPYNIKLADANAASPACDVAGIALNGAAAGQPISYAVADPAFVIGATLATGDRVYASATAGGLTKTDADLTGTGYKVTLLGIMVTTTTMNLAIVPGGTLP